MPLQRTARVDLGDGVAERAGFVRDPGRDGRREVEGESWPVLAYRLP
jgi:hypothetical protein